MPLNCGYRRVPALIAVEKIGPAVRQRARRIDQIHVALVPQVAGAGVDIAEDHFVVLRELPLDLNAGVDGVGILETGRHGENAGEAGRVAPGRKLNTFGNAGAFGVPGRERIGEGAGGAVIDERVVPEVGGRRFVEQAGTGAQHGPGRELPGEAQAGRPVAIRRREMLRLGERRVGLARRRLEPVPAHAVDHEQVGPHLPAILHVEIVEVRLVRRPRRPQHGLKSGIRVRTCSALGGQVAGDARRTCTG